MSGRASISLLVFALGCMTGEHADRGADAGLAVRGGSFVRGPLPQSNGGPVVAAAYLTQSHFPVGFQGKSFSGVLGSTATAAAIALAGDRGHWIVSAGPPLVETPDLPSFDAPLSFASNVGAGPHVLFVAAVDVDRRFGVAKAVPFTLTEHLLPDGPLVFSLSWDRPSDLDLHVISPDGTEIYKDNVNSANPTVGTDPDPEAFREGGRLDFDSNAQCRIDGRNRESVTWSVEPPPGRYIVRVDTFSLCDEKTARWTVEAFFHGERVALSTGTSLSTNTRYPHGAGAGITAFELSVP